MDTPADQQQIMMALSQYVADLQQQSQASGMLLARCETWLEVVALLLIAVVFFEALRRN